MKILEQVIVRTKKISRSSVYYDGDKPYKKMLTRLRNISDKNLSELEKRLLVDAASHIIRIHSGHRPPQYISEKLKDFVSNKQIAIHSHSDRNKIKDNCGLSTRWEHCNPVAKLVNRVLETKDSMQSILNDNIIAIITLEEDSELRVEGIREKRMTETWEYIYEKAGIQPVKYKLDYN